MKKYIYILILALSTGIFSSCGDWLSLSPEDGVTLEEFWKTKEQVNSAVIGCYCSLMNGVVTKMFLWGELRADMLESGVNINSNYSNIMDGEISAANAIVDWSDFYTTINQCNTVLKFAKSVKSVDGTFTDKQLKAYEAEALTLRAMMYFYLVRSFGDVPLIREASVSDDQNFAIAKTSGVLILDSLVQDLKIAAANAPVSYETTAENKSRITCWSAKALLADIYLWQEKYAECNSLCREIIGSGKFSMIPIERVAYQITSGGVPIDTVYVPNESDADKMFTQSYVDGNSIESIFEIPFTTEKTLPFFSMLAPNINYLKPKMDNMSGTIFPDAMYMSEASDIRGSGCSYRLGVIWKYNGVSRTGSARTSTNYTSPWIVYKYADVLLMQAEALNQLGLKASAETAQNYYAQSIESLQAVRNARNAVRTTDYRFSYGNVDGKTLEKAILNERAREFAYEGKRWYDVLRNAKRNDYAGNNIDYLVSLAVSSASPEKQQSLIAKYKSNGHYFQYWPIYIDELESNKLLKQNEFYAK